MFFSTCYHEETRTTHLARDREPFSFEAEILGHFDNVRDSLDIYAGHGVPRGRSRRISAASRSVGHSLVRACRRVVTILAWLIEASYAYSTSIPGEDQNDPEYPVPLYVDRSQMLLEGIEILTSRVVTPVGRTSDLVLQSRERQAGVHPCMPLVPGSYINSNAEQSRKERA